MASPPKTPTYTTQRQYVTNEPSELAKSILFGAPASVGNQYYSDASSRAAMLRGVQYNDPSSLRQFYQGLKPTDMPKNLNKILKNRAQGGLMTLGKGYAAGGQAKNLTDAQLAELKTIYAAIREGTVTDAQKNRLKVMETNTQRDVSPYDNIATTPIQNAAAKNQLAQAVDVINANKDIKSGDIPQAPTPSDAYYRDTPGVEVTPNFQKDANGNLILDSNGQPIREKGSTYEVTNPYFKEADTFLDTMQKPEQYQQSTELFNKAAQGLIDNANYKPSNITSSNIGMREVNAGSVDPMMLNPNGFQGSAAQMAGVKDVSANQVSAAQMQAIKDVAAERVAAAQMAGVRDVAAERIAGINIAGAQMARPENVSAMQMQQYQMNPNNIQDVENNKNLQYFQMDGPGSWTDEGVSQQYMNPYIQNVIDIAKRESGRDYEKELRKINAQSVAAGAYGGSRQAIERAEAARNYAQLQADIEDKGMSQAYQQGMGQWTNEEGLSQQAAIQNLAAKLGVQSQMSQEQLQAALANQGIDYQVALQNLQAKLGVQESQARNMLQAALSNQQMGFGTAQANLNAMMQTQLANQQAGMTAQQANQQAALNAALANQQTQFNVGALNANNAQQANLANAQNALQASLANQQTAFNTGAFNAGNQQQANLANAQNSLQASLANQQTAYNTGAFNAGNQQQMNLANQQAALNAALANQSTNLTGQTTNLQANLQGQLANQDAAYKALLANQQADLAAQQANQQAGLSALNANNNALANAGNLASGLGAIGTSSGNWDQQKLSNIGALGNASQNLLDNAAMLNQTGAAGVQTGVPTILTGPTNSAYGLGTSQNTGTQAPTPLGR